MLGCFNACLTLVTSLVNKEDEPQAQSFDEIGEFSDWKLVTSGRVILVGLGFFMCEGTGLFNSYITKK